MREALADAHLWVAEEMLLANDEAGGREHLLNSLRYGPSGRALRHLAVSLLPSGMQSGLRRTYRHLKEARA